MDEAASPRGSVSLGGVACELMKTVPCSGGSPPHRAPRVSFRRGRMRCVSEDGASRGHEDVAPAAVGAVGRASGYVLFRVFFFWGGLFALGGPVQVWWVKERRITRAEGRGRAGLAARTGLRQMTASRCPPCRAGDRGRAPLEAPPLDN